MIPPSNPYFLMISGVISLIILIIAMCTEEKQAEKPQKEKEIAVSIKNTYTQREVEELLRQQRLLIADKLVPSRKGIVQETEYHRIMNAKLKIA